MEGRTTEVVRTFELLPLQQRFQQRTGCRAVASSKNVCLVPVDVAGQQGTFSFAGAVANLRQDLQKCSLLGSLLCVWCGVTQNNTGTPKTLQPHRHTQTQTTLTLDRFRLRMPYRVLGLEQWMSMNKNLEELV